MPELVGIRFKQASPVYFFDPAGIEFGVGDMVIVETTRGLSMGRVISGPAETLINENQEPPKSVIRKAGTEEIRKAEEFQAKSAETLAKCKEAIAKHDLPMKLISADYNFDGSHLTVFFRAESKVDFRNLLKELGGIFKTRVELRQIGDRDVAKLLGGIGGCGRELCCTSHLNKFEPISIKMARSQDLPLNPAKISGACGKLLCCLSYENSQYLAVKKGLPAVGKAVSTTRGPGKVVQMNTLRETVTVQLENDTRVEIPAAEINKSPQKDN